jgi:FixJ family two-component response regulator
VIEVPHLPGVERNCFLFVVIHANGHPPARVDLLEGAKCAVSDMQLTIRRGELRARFAALIKRELQVLGHVVLGRLNKQITADLCIHERTVKLHRTAITTKLRVQSAAELTRLTDEAGIFTASKPTFP